MDKELERVGDEIKPRRQGPGDSWYKRDPNVALRGMAKLTNEQCGAYAKLIELTYARGAPPEDDRHLAALLYMPGKVWARLKRELVAVGRIRIIGGLVVDDRSQLTLLERAIERQQAVEKGAVGGRLSAARRDSPARNPGGEEDSLRKNPPIPKSEAGKNKALVQGGLNQVESESDTYQEGSLRDEDDLTVDASPAEQGSNVVPIAEARGATNATEVHFVLAKAAGHRLVLSDELFSSVNFIASALGAGCDANLDLLPVVIDRTHGRGGPIRTWRYFAAAWADHRDRRHSGKQKTRRAR